MDISQQMRADWDARARADARFYVAFVHPGQEEDGFQASAAEVIPTLAEEFCRLPQGPDGQRRALEIGCGLGRLMLPMSPYFDEIHGVDVSEEMVMRARERLRDCNACVQVNSGVDLTMFPDDYFDFVYSFIVFQHIPDRSIVLNYLREARRVLKPGGVLRCQLRGTQAPRSERLKEPTTWTGCFFTAKDVAQFAREQAFPLVAISGLDTQYMWTTFRKPLRTSGSSAPGRITVKDVTSASGPEARVPNRGPDAAVSLWIDGMPEDASLADFRVLFGEREQTGCYLSPVSDSGGCQVNARLPEGMAPGEYAVRLVSERLATEGTHPVVVEAAPPFKPRVLSVTDGLNLSAANRTDTRSAKVTIEDVRDPEEFSFTVAGLSIVNFQYECLDPTTATFVFSFHVHHRVRSGRRTLAVMVGGAELEAIGFEVLK